MQRAVVEGRKAAINVLSMRSVHAKSGGGGESAGEAALSYLIEGLAWMPAVMQGANMQAITRRAVEGAAVL